MIEQLIDYLERHRPDIRAHTCGFDHVDRVTQACSQDLGFSLVVLIDLDDVLQQDESVFADVIQPA